LAAKARRIMRTIRVAGIAAVAIFAIYPVHAPFAEESTAPQVHALRAPADTEAVRGGVTEQATARERLDRDLDSMRTYRPGYGFWAHVFTVPNGRIAYGSASEGRLLATFPVRGDWIQAAHWEEDSYADLFAHLPVAGRLAQRREDTARLLA